MHYFNNTDLAHINKQFDELVTRHSIINQSMALETLGFPSEICLKLALLAMVNGGIVVGDTEGSYRYQNPAAPDS